MKMNTSKHKGKIYSFWELLQKHRVEIPIIQRDYAQGREDKEELRVSFLTALFNSLNETIGIKLDFIYGDKPNEIFQPLDGQQRLTTLFLIHWYAMIKESKNEPENINILENFSYETRASSREFCKALVNCSIGIKEGYKVSDFIIDSPWFFLSWKKDPTITSMLRTIDDIHKQFYLIDDLWVKLTSEDRLISFYHVELEDIGLTDDLYIKMNSRGKLLSPFENFKASFQKFIRDQQWESEKAFTETFSYKIDTEWTDLFWKHRKNNSIDNSIIRFISSIAMIRQVLEKSDDRINTISRLQRQPDLVRVEHFSKSGYGFLFEYLETYVHVFKNNVPVDLELPFWQHSPQDNIFSALVYEDNNASYTQKVLFFAQTEYLRTQTEFDQKNFSNWMRVIRNIISRGDVTKNGERPAIIRSPETFEGVINLINELAEGCGNIYKFLQDHTIKSTFAREQIEEELIKSHLINVSPDNEGVIFQMEDSNFFRGRIAFSFYRIDFNTVKDIFLKSDFEKILEVIEKYLETETLSDDLRRALLTIQDDDGQFEYYNYWWSWSYVADANKRCLIAKYRELEYYIYGNYKERDHYKQYLKKLLIQLTKKDLKDLINEFTPPEDMPNWKIRLIKEPELLGARCKSKYIAIPENQESCFLLKGIRPRDMNGCEKIE